MLLMLDRLNSANWHNIRLKMKYLKSPIYLLAWFVFIAACAYIIPYFSNDYRYMMIEGTQDLVSSFSDIVVSQYRHYFTWGGRTPPHVLAQLLLWGGKYVSAVGAGLCYLVLIYLIYVQAKGKRVNPFKLLILPVLFITVALWLCLRAYGEVIFMLVTSCNYLYTTTFILAFLLPYRFSINADNCKKSVPFAIMMFLLGIIAGWCNENTGFAICAANFLLCLYLYKVKKLSFWHITGFVGTCIGFLVLVLSPGNNARLEMMETTGSFNYFSHLAVTLDIFFLTLLEELPLILSLVYLLFIAYKNKFFSKDKFAEYKNDFIGVLYLFIFGFASLAIMIFSPNFPARTATPFTCALIACISGVYFILNKEDIKVMPKTMTVSLYTLSFVYILVTGENALGGLLKVKQDMVERDYEIQQQLDAGVKDLVVSPLTVETSRYIFVADVRTKPTFFANEILSRFYHVNSIVRTCDFAKNVKHSDLIIYQHYGEPVCSVKKP